MNFTQFSIALETLGVLFISFDFIVSRRYRRKLNVKLHGWLEAGSHSKQAIVATALCLVCIIVWAVVTDWQSNQTPSELGLSMLSILLMLAGVLGGIAVPIFTSRVIALILTKARSKFGFSCEINQPLVIYIVSVIMSVLGVFLFAKAAEISIIVLVPFSLTFALASVFLGAWTNAIPLLQRWLALDREPVSRVGMLLFLIAKIMQFIISGGV